MHRSFLFYKIYINGIEMAHSTNENPMAGNGWLSRDTYIRHNYRGDKGRFPNAVERDRERTLANWLGKERSPDVFAALRPKLKSASELVDSVMCNLHQGDVFVLHRLCDEWDCIVGAVNAKQTKPVFVRDGLLTIEVANPTWLYIFRLQQGKMLTEKIAAYTHNKIREVRFVPPGRS